MKKQILALTICITLANTSVLASNLISQNPSGTIKSNIQSKESTCIKSTEPTALTPEQMKQKFEEKMQKGREDLYSKLGLTTEQKAKAEELDKKNRAEAKSLICKIHEEKSKLKALEARKANSIELYIQKQRLGAAKKALHKHFVSSEKSFEALLTKDQLAKLNSIKEERRAKMAKYRKNCCKNHQRHQCPCKNNDKPCPTESK